MSRLLSIILHLIIEKLKGPDRFTEIHRPDVASGRMIASDMIGDSIEICCQRRHYRRSYDKWYVTDKDIIVYRVFAIPSGDLSEEAVRAFRLDIEIPALLPLTMSEDDQCKAVIKAYIDIIAHRLEKK